MAKTTSGNWLRVLRPLFWWLLLLLALYGIRTHQRLSALTHLDFTITMNGQPLNDATALLDGQPVVSGQWIAIGSHKFTVTHPKGEVFSTNLFFHWYGRHDLGGINLPRSHGSLGIVADPPASQITIIGPEFSLTLHNSAGTNVTVPTDQYEVRAQYPHWGQAQSASVPANQVVRCLFLPRFGALHLTSNHAGTAYQLQTPDGQEMGSGTMPAIVTELPTGNYQVTASYHQRQMQTATKVDAALTNEVPVKFILGSARLETVPSGARVYATNGNYLGITPLDLQDVHPQTARFDLSLAGYEPVSVAMEIAADQTNVCRTNLLSLRYGQALREARQYLAAGNDNGVLQSTKEVLGIKPGDTEALALQATASEHLDTARKRMADEQQRAERLKRPRTAFDLLCGSRPDARLFAEHELKTSKPARAVEAAIVKSLQAAPMGYEIVNDETPEPETYSVVASQTFSLGILGGNERMCLLVVGQTKDDETQILFKIMEYRIQHTLVNLKDVKQLIPVCPGRIQITDALLSQVRTGLQTVMERIENGIKAVP